MVWGRSDGKPTLSGGKGKGAPCWSEELHTFSTTAKTSWKKSKNKVVFANASTIRCHLPRNFLFPNVVGQIHFSGLIVFCFLGFAQHFLLCQARKKHNLKQTNKQTKTEVKSRNKTTICFHHHNIGAVCSPVAPGSESSSQCFVFSPSWNHLTTHTYTHMHTHTHSILHFQIILRFASSPLLKRSWNHRVSQLSVNARPPSRWSEIILN